MIQFSNQPKISDELTLNFSSFLIDAKLFNVECTFYVLVYKFSLFDCSGARLLKVPVVIGPKMPFLRYQ